MEVAFVVGETSLRGVRTVASPPARSITRRKTRNSVDRCASTASTSRARFSGTRTPHDSGTTPFNGIRRSLAKAGGVVQTNLKEVAQIHYLKVAEVQRRGLIHIHSVIRADGPESIDVDPPEWLTPEVLSKVVRDSIGRASATRLDGKTVRWGRMLDIRDLGPVTDDAKKVASYVAKYSTKTTDGTRDLARRFHSRRQIEELVDNPISGGWR